MVVGSKRQTSRAARRRRTEIVLVPGLGRRLLRGRWLVITLLVLLAAAVMIRLGFWQLSRLQGRRAANAAIERQIAAPPLALDGAALAAADSDALAFRRVVVRGTWDYDREFELRFRSYDGQPGVHLLTPLRVAGTDRAILVDRGWIPLSQAGPTGRRAFNQGPEGEAQGLAYVSIPSDSPPTGTGGPRQDAIAQIDLAAIGAQLPYPLAPVWVRRLPVGDNRTPPLAESPPDLGDGTHLAYTIQWWAFAATLLITYVIFANQMLRREDRLRRDARTRADDQHERTS